MQTRHTGMMSIIANEAMTVSVASETRPMAAAGPSQSQGHPVASFSPGRVFASGVTKLIVMSLFGVAPGVLVLWLLSNSNAPFLVWIVPGLVLLASAAAVVNSIARMRAASFKSSYLKADAEGMTICYPCEELISYQLRAYRIRWDEIAQIQYYSGRFRQEVRIFAKNGARLDIPNYVFDASAWDLQRQLRERWSAAR